MSIKSDIIRSGQVLQPRSCLTRLPVYLFVIPWALHHVGGVNQVVLNLARQINLEGAFEPVFLIADWAARKPVWEVFQGFRVVRWRVRYSGPASGIKQRIITAIWRIRFARTFRFFCAEAGVCVINHHYPSYAALTLSSIVEDFVPSIRTIISFHGGDVTAFQAAEPHRLEVWRKMLRQGHAVTVCSHALARRFQQVFGFLPTVIHNGIDVEAFCEAAGARWSPDRKFILNVGRFDETKGQDVLIRAFGEIANIYPELDLVLIGARDVRLQSLRELCLQLGVQSRVNFRLDTPHKEVAHYFAGASVFVLSSRQEAFGIVLLEAGCMGLPVVASAVGGIPEVIEDGVTGLLVQPNCPEELARALRSVLDSVTSASSIGDRLRERVMDKFSWRVAYSSYVSLVHSRRDLSSR